jgi:hypothetical protein
MRSRAWAWLIALMALVLAVIPLAAMSVGGPMSIAAANICWIAAIVLTIVAFAMSLRQGLRTRV